MGSVHAFIVLLALFAAAEVASAQTNGLFGLSWSTVNGASGVSANGNWQISGTAGQPDAGTLANGSWAVYGGFWNRVVFNTPPTATNFVVGTVMNTAVSFTETQLLRSASDADGDTVTLSALDSTSTNGATVTDVSGTITYTPMTGFVGADAFGYTVSDTYGATATNVVNVVVRAGNYSSTLTDLTTQEDGTMQFNASGLPGYTYGVQATTSLDSPDWETIGSAMAGDNGLIQYDDEDSTNYTTRYYRLVYPYTP
jgi:predicted lipoprotein with Yx(FWY)xxD motif